MRNDESLPLQMLNVMQGGDKIRLMDKRRKRALQKLRVSICFILFLKYVPKTRAHSFKIRPERYHSAFALGPCVPEVKLKLSMGKF